MCDQQRLRPACAYAQSDQSLCWSLEYCMSVKLLTEHHMEFLSLKGGFTGSSESTLVKIPHCWKSYPRHEISNNVVCATSKGSDQPAHTRSLIRARVCWSLEYYMSVKLLTEHHLEFLSLKGGCTGSSESTLVKMPHCWKSHVTAQLFLFQSEQHQLP